MQKQKTNFNLQSGIGSILLVVFLAIIGIVLVFNIALVKSVCSNNWFAKMFKVNNICSQNNSKLSQSLSLKGNELSIDSSKVILPDFNSLNSKINSLEINQQNSLQSNQNNYYNTYLKAFNAPTCGTYQSSSYNGNSFICVNAGGTLNDAYNFGGAAAGRTIITTTNNQPIKIINTYGSGLAGYNSALEIVGDGSPTNPANSGIVFGKLSLTGYSDAPGLFFSGHTDDLVGGSVFGVNIYNNDPGNESLNIGLVKELNLVDLFQLNVNGAGLMVASSLTDDGYGNSISMSTGSSGSNSGGGGNFSIDTGASIGTIGGVGGSFIVNTGGSSYGSGGNVQFNTGGGATGNGIISFSVNGAERGRFDSNGDFGLSNQNPAYFLHVGSSSTTSGTTVARFENAGGSCDITPNVAGGVSCTSDERLKKDVSELASALEQLGAINVVKYHYKAEDQTTGLHTGFIAQDLEKILPDLVQTDKNGYKSVSYAGLTPYLVKATQEQNVRLDSLELKSNNLEAQFTQLGVKLDSISSELDSLNNNFEDLQKQFTDYKTKTDAKILELEEKLNKQ